MLIDRKKCTHCEDEKPLFDFALDSKAKDGTSSECKKCKRLYNGKSYNLKRKKKYKETLTPRVLKGKDYLYNSVKSLIENERG